MSDSGKNPGLNDGAAAPFQGKEQQSADPVLAFAMSRFNSESEALKWYRTAALPDFGGATPEALVREGRADDVMDAFRAADAGVCA